MRSRRLARLQQNKPVSALTSAVTWVELLAQEKDLTMLRPYSTQMNFLSRNSLDVYAVFLTVITTVTLITFVLVRCLCRVCCCRKSRPKSKVE